jgi:alkyl hydroperoxide reductase subunit AhpF
MGKLLDENIQKQVVEVFKSMKEPVAILFFGSRSENCEYCESTFDLLQEIVPLSPLISLEEYDLADQAELAARYHLDKAPGFVLAGKVDGQFIDYGIRYAGIPAGHEFSSLINDLVLVSRRDSGLKPDTREFLKNLQKPVHLQVFVTPT